MMSDFQYERIVRLALETPWAILPGKLAVIRELLAFRASGGRLTAEEVRARLATPLGARIVMARNGKDSTTAARSSRKTAGQGGAVAVLPLVGTIIPRLDLMAESSGAVSLQRFGAAFREAMADPEVGSIVIDVDSPGGMVDGVVEMADEIFEARASTGSATGSGADGKRIVAVANTFMASAAYWIGSAADEVVISPSAEVGSIGVLAMHQDFSEALAQEGVAVTLISAGKYKAEENPFEPLEEEAREAMQERVNEYYEMFVAAVARGRGVSVKDVRNGFGEGRVVWAKEAVRLGMADRVGTLNEVIGELVGGGSGRSATSTGLASTGSASEGRSAAGDLDFRRRRARMARNGR